MLPDVHAEQRRLAVGERVVLLGVETTASPEPSCTSQDQPEPNWPTPASLNWTWKSPKEPKADSIAEARSPSGSPPPSGDIHSQNSEWLK